MWQLKTNYKHMKTEDILSLKLKFKKGILTALIN